MISTMSEQKLQVFAFAVRYLHNTQQDIDFKDWDKDFLEQYKNYMDLVEDAPHDLTKVEIPVMGSDVIDGPKFFEFSEDTLGTACTSCDAFYGYIIRPCILFIYDGDKLFDFFKRFKEDKKNQGFSTTDEEHIRRRHLTKV